MFFDRVFVLSLVSAYLFSSVCCDQKVLSELNGIANKPITFLEQQSPFASSEQSLKREKRHLLWPSGVSKVYFPKLLAICSL